MSEVIREARTENFTTMGTYHLKDKNLSLKAKGLLSIMLSLPPEWQFNIKGLTTLNHDGIDATRSALVELEKAGYLVRKRIRSADGFYMKNEYIIREKAIKIKTGEIDELEPMAFEDAAFGDISDGNAKETYNCKSNMGYAGDGKATSGYDNGIYY